MYVALRDLQHDCLKKTVFYGFEKEFLQRLQFQIIIICLTELIYILLQACDALKASYNKVLERDNDVIANSASVNPLMVNILIKVHVSWVIWNTIGDNPRQLSGVEVSNTPFNERNRELQYADIFISIITNHKEIMWSVIGDVYLVQPLKRQSHNLTNEEVVNFLHIFIDGDKHPCIGVTDPELKNRGIPWLRATREMKCALPLPVLRTIFGTLSAPVDRIKALRNACAYYMGLEDQLAGNMSKEGLFITSKDADLKALIERRFPAHDVVSKHPIHFGVLGNYGLRAFVVDYTTGVTHNDRVNRSTYLYSIFRFLVVPAARAKQEADLKGENQKQSGQKAEKTASGKTPKKGNRGKKAVSVKKQVKSS
jgi:hypothetical protein